MIDYNLVDFFRECTEKRTPLRPGKEKSKLTSITLKFTFQYLQVEIILENMLSMHNFHVMKIHRNKTDQPPPHPH